MRISIIVAWGHKLEIGKAGSLLWHISEDLKNFKKVTLGHCVLMGRKTFESIGKPLPGRTNIVISRQPNFTHEGVFTSDSLAIGIATARDRGENELFVIGGGEIYKQILPLCDRIYLSEIDDHDPSADTFFPDSYGSYKWDEISKTHFQATEKNPAWTYRILDRI